MGDVWLRDTDPDDFRRQLAAEVTEAVIERLSEKLQPRLVDRQTMAKLAGIGVTTLDAMARDGLIPSVTVGTRRLFAPTDVIDALKNG